MEHRHDQPRTSRVRARVARPVELSGALVALVGALFLLLLL